MGLKMADNSSPGFFLSFYIDGLRLYRSCPDEATKMASNKCPIVRQQAFKLPWQQHDSLNPPLILALSTRSSKTTSMTPPQ